jgi:glycosyltransferase involved in cell wall biosynthesis
MSTAMVDQQACGGKSTLPVSVVIPVKNEETNLPLCLESVKGFDEVVIVDSGSTDRTCEIAKHYGREVLEFKWDGKFPKKRNWVLKTYAFKHPWILFLDADECVTPEFQSEIEQTLSHTQHKAFWIGYNEWSLGHLLRHGDPMWKNALVRLGSGEYERIQEEQWTSLDMEIHEHLIVDGSVGTITARLEHRDKRTLESYYARHNEYSTWEAHRFLSIRDKSQLTVRQKVKYGILMWPFFPLLYFTYTYIVKMGILDGKVGLYYALAKVFYFYQIQAKVTELRQTVKRKLQ